MYRCGSKESLDPAVAKADERMKLCLTTQRFIDNYKF